MAACLICKISQYRFPQVISAFDGLIIYPVFTLKFSLTGKKAAGKFFSYLNSFWKNISPVRLLSRYTDAFRYNPFPDTISLPE